MDMLAMPVRLVVKAPNQQIEDQTVECALDWTVQKLKAYLSEAYPSKPKAEEQKLIYSGQLLHDHLMLKDFLRQYEAEAVHTVHLVCLPSRDVPISAPKSFSAHPPPQPSAPSCPTPDSIHSDGVRQRLSSTSQTTNTPASPSFYPMPNMAGPMPLDLRAQQMLWMQHMYSQYMNLYVQNYPGGHPMMPTHPHREATEDVIPAEDQQPQPPPNPNPNEGENRPPANENIRLNAQGGPDEEDAEVAGNRDWLDWFYILSRAAVLFSIVYFYSSFNRFALVVLFAALMYLFKKRANNFARIRNNRAIVRPIVLQPAPEENNEQGQDVPENEAAEQMQRETREIEELMNRDLDNENAQNRGAASLVQVVWTIVATFFSSLLPEQHDPFNLN